MKFLHVFLAAFLIISCNDEKQASKQVVDCSKIQDGAQVSKQCLLGSWLSVSGSYKNMSSHGTKIKIDENNIVGSLDVYDSVSNDVIGIGVDDTYTYKDGKIRFNYQGNPVNLTVIGVESDRRRLIRTHFINENGDDVFQATWQKTLDCPIDLDEKCPLGKWKIQSAKLGEKGQSLADLTLTDGQKGQSLDLKSDEISGKIVFVRVDQIALEDSLIKLRESGTFYNFIGKDKEITFKKNGDGELIKLKIKEVKDNQLTLELSGKTEGSNPKEYVLETLWSKE